MISFQSLLRSGALLLLLILSLPVIGQQIPDPKVYDAVQWRLVGPFRGGRADAVTGVKGNDKSYYFAMLAVAKKPSVAMFPLATGYGKVPMQAKPGPAQVWIKAVLFLAYESIQAIPL